MFKGIDLSEWNYNFPAKTIAEYDFCIIRAALTGYGGNGTSKYIDNYFETNYKKCKDNNTPVGCYYYSCARTREQGQEEARFLLEHCLKGKQFEYPIFIDVENEQWQTNNKQGVTDAVKGFCEYLENRGYFVGVYGSDVSTFKEKVYLSELTRYTLWVASWGAKPQYVSSYGLWQYSGNNLDEDYSYQDYASIIKNGGFNGFSTEQVEPELKTFRINVTLEVEAVTEEEAKSNIKGLYNTVSSVKTIDIND